MRVGRLLRGAIRSRAIVWGRIGSVFAGITVHLGTISLKLVFYFLQVLINAYWGGARISLLVTGLGRLPRGASRYSADIRVKVSLAVGIAIRRAAIAGFRIRSIFARGSTVPNPTIWDMFVCCTWVFHLVS